MAEFRTGDTLIWYIGPLLSNVDSSALTGKAGSLTATVATRPDSTTFAPTFAEVAGGVYTASVVSTMRGRWFLSTHYGGTDCDLTDWPDFIDVDDADGMTPTRAAKLDQIGAASLAITSPVALDQTVTIYQGDDYKAQSSRSIPFVLTGFPTLAGATVTLFIKWRSSSLAVVCTVSNAGQNAQTATAELTAAQTATFEQSITQYDLSATLANGDAITLGRGKVNVVADVTI